jgi:hypothetical protein
MRSGGTPDSVPHGDRQRQDAWLPVFTVWTIGSTVCPQISPQDVDNLRKSSPLTNLLKGDASGVQASMIVRTQHDAFRNFCDYFSGAAIEADTQAKSFSR